MMLAPFCSSMVRDYLDIHNSPASTAISLRSISALWKRVKGVSDVSAVSVVSKPVTKWFAAPSRYQQPHDSSFMSLDKSEFEASEYSDKNDYGDDNFELDQTTIGDLPGLQKPTMTETMNIVEVCV
jgi:hypothetical protein